jgi:hypothetical protein
MGAPLIRPRVADVVFRLYSRPLHPELFDVLACRTVLRDGYTLSVRLTRTGHLLAWTSGRIHLSEAIATIDMQLPGSGCCLGHRFDGGQSGKSRVGSVRYQVSSQVELLQPEQYLHVHEELAEEGSRKGMVFHCKSGNRLGLSPLGVVIVQTVPHGLNTSAFHTFPDERAIIKTQSLIEWD